MTWCWPNGVTDPASPPPMGAGYGPRDPILTPGGWTGGFHTGVDFKHNFSTVRSIGPGTVIHVGDRGTGNGLEVVVDHGSWLSRYYHLASRAADIYVGVVVNGGRALGAMGDTGKAKGIHLHLRFDAQESPGATSGPSFDPLPLLVNLMRDQANAPAGGGGTPIPPADWLDMATQAEVQALLDAQSAKILDAVRREARGWRLFRNTDKPAGAPDQYVAINPELDASDARKVIYLNEYEANSLRLNYLMIGDQPLNAQPITTANLATAIALANGTDQVYTTPTT